MTEIIVKKSRFIAFSFDIKTKEEFKKLYLNIKEEHKNSRHITYAYIINDGVSAGMSDDGEPKGTAGKPIFNLLNIKGVTNKVIFVVRYWGGKKLGSSLLLRSYVNAAKGEL